MELGLVVDQGGSLCLDNSSFSLEGEVFVIPIAEDLGDLFLYGQPDSVWVNVFPYLSPNIGEVSVVWQTRELMVELWWTC